MNRFWAFVTKEFYHIFRDKRSLLILLGMPIAQILIFGYVLNNDIKNVPFAVLDQSHDNLSRKVVEKLVSSGYFQLNGYIDKQEDIEKILRKGVVKEVIIFEPNFAEKFRSENKASMQVIADASDANTANLIVNYTTGIVRTLNADENKALPQRPVIEVKPRMMFNENIESTFMFIPGTIAMLLMLVSAMMTSISFTREKEQGTMQVLLVSPLKPIQIVIGKVTPYIGLSLMNAITILLLGVFIFGVPIRGSLILLFLELLLFLILSLTLGIFISIKAKNQQIAMLISMFALMLPTMLLSGFIYPIENMPVWLQWISAVIPARWFNVIIKNIMLYGTDITYFWKETLIIFGETLLLIVASVKSFKIRLE
jgi:ABC-2 type transport system permease protein